MVKATEAKQHVDEYSRPPRAAPEAITASCCLSQHNRISAYVSNSRNAKLSTKYYPII